MVKLAELACEWNNLIQARNIVEEGVKLCKLCGQVDLLAEAYAAQAQVQLACGDYAGTHTTLQFADEISVRTKIDPWATAWLEDSRVRLWLSTGDLDIANHWMATSELDIQGDISYHHELNHITLTRVMVANILHKSTGADANQCLDLLARLLTATEEMGWSHHKIQVLILQALVLSATGSKKDAMQALTLALSIAEPGGYVRTFISEGIVMRQLLETIAEQKRNSGYIEALIQAFPTEPFNQSFGLVEPLSEREMEVMILLTTSLSVPEIAKEMILSPNTVRSHIKNIYSKLDVNRRLDAINKAKELRLL